MKLEDDKHCFACGSANKAGLGLKFDLNNSILTTRFTPQKTHQGFKDIVHGGIIGLILDEVMVNLLWKLNKPAVSAEINLRLKRPAKVGQTLTFSGRIIREGGRLIETYGEALDPGGLIVASATAKCLKMR